MKSIMLSAMIMVLAFSAFSQEGEPFMMKNFTNVKKVKATTAGGNISVEGGNETGVRVKVYIRGSDYNSRLSDAEIRERLERDYTLKMEMEGDVLVLYAKNRNNVNWKRGLSISFSVTVPRNTSNDLTTSGGNIVLRGVEGIQEFVTSGGNLVVTNVKGKIDGSTSGGNITAEGLSENIDLSTSGGNVSAENCKGSIKLTTSGGNVNMANLNGTIGASTSGGNVTGRGIKGEIQAGTSGGNVNLEQVSGSVRAGTSGGRIKLFMEEVGSYVKLSNSGGGIDLTLPAGKGYDLDIRGSNIKTESLSNFSGSVSETRLNGKLNGGGSPITIDRADGVRLSFNK